MITPSRLCRTLCLAALFGGASTFSLHAQQDTDAPSHGGHGGHHGPPPSVLFDALDTNHDGTLSADEMNNATAALKALLKNGATQLTREDLRPPRPDPAANRGAATGTTSGGQQPSDDQANHPRHHGPPPSPLFDALDVNHDGMISDDEMASAPASLKALLKNGATQLTRDDLRPQHSPRPPQN